MDNREISRVLDDLEPRIERLKSLYQQYFMGIEKIPPRVLHKDVDRTIWRLRGAKFQNTQLRFKFQQIVQRYNTYKQYWQRIMRDIERGTHKRDMVRAAQRFGQDDVLREVGHAARTALRAQLGDGEDAPAPTPTWELDPDNLDVSSKEEEEKAPAPDVAEKRRRPAAMPPRVGLEVEAAAAEAASEKAASEKAAGEEATGAAKQKPRRGALFGKRPEMPKRPPPPALAARDAREGEGATAAQGLAPQSKQAPPQGAALRRPPPPAANPAREPDAQSERRAPGGIAAGRRPPPPPRKPPPPPRREVPSPEGASRAQPTAGKPPQRDERARVIYEELVRARRASGETTNDLSYDKLQRSLAKQTERLRSKYGNRDVDYEVVTKDGRTMIKPVIKK